MSAVTRLRTNEELILPCAPEDVWAVLSDVPAYPRWWPARLRVSVLNLTPELLGTQIEVKPFLARSNRVRFEEVEEPRIIRMRLFGGSLEGPVTLLIESLADTTRLRCDVDVFARGLDVEAIGLIFPLQKVQALQIRRWLRSVRSRVASRRRAARAVEKTGIRVLEAAVPPAEGAALPPTVEMVVGPVPLTSIGPPLADERSPVAVQAGSKEATEPVVNPAGSRLQILALRAAQWLRESPHMSLPTPPPTASPEPRSNCELASRGFETSSDEPKIAADSDAAAKRARTEPVVTS